MLTQGPLVLYLDVMHEKHQGLELVILNVFYMSLFCTQAVKLAYAPQIELRRTGQSLEAEHWVLDAQLWSAHADLAPNLVITYSNGSVQQLACASQGTLAVQVSKLELAAQPHLHELCSICKRHTQAVSACHASNATKSDAGWRTGRGYCC